MQHNAPIIAAEGFNAEPYVQVKPHLQDRSYHNSLVEVFTVVFHVFDCSRSAV